MVEIIKILSKGVAKKIGDRCKILRHEAFIAEECGWIQDSIELEKAANRLDKKYKQVFINCGGSEELLRKYQNKPYS